MGRLILVGLLAFAVALAGSAYAEVQNVKVGGDIDMKAISHNNYDLKFKQKNEPGPGTTGGTIPAVTNDDDAGLYLSTVRLTVDADLTDNVSAHVRLLNQRFWDTDIDATNNIDLDNAYVVLKEFLYSPLTVMVGKQDLQYGNGFIVGPGLLGDPNVMFSSTAIGFGGGAEQTQIAQEYSAYNAYDAIRLILDYAPVTVEGLISKINETAVTGDDQDLYGVVVNYKPDMWGISEIEPYWFYKSLDTGSGILVNDSRLTATAARTYDQTRIHTFGIRSAASPIENLSLNGEVAFQIGDMKDITTEVKERKQFGIGADVAAKYNWVNVPWTPATGLEWVYFSGEQSSGEREAGLTANDQGDTFNAWNPMFRGKFWGYIQDFLGGADSAGGPAYVTFDQNDTHAGTNRHLLIGSVSLKPMEDLTLWGQFMQVWFAREPRTGRSKDAGREVDLKAMYDYTEDVQLALFGGWFFPGTYYDQRTSNTRGGDLAWTVGSSAAVKF